MGCRHLICIYHASRIVVAQYGGHDGYPSYTGVSIMESLSDPRYVSRLRSKLSLIRHRDLNADYSEWDGGYIDEDAGVAVLDDIAWAGKPVLVYFQLEFADEGGMCEWCYVVDLDREVLEVYRGFGNRRRGGAPLVLSGRLAEVGVRQQWLRVTIPFIDLPGDKKELVEACERGLEEDGLW